MGQKWPIGDKGPVCVTWDYGTTDLRIDPYNDTVMFTDESEVEFVYEDGFGRTPVDAIDAGSVVGLEVPLARNTVVMLNSLLPGTALTGTTKLVFSVRAGCSWYDSACPILLQPKCDNVCDTNKDHWFRIFYAYPYRAFSLPFNYGDQRVFNVKFAVFPNQTSPNIGEHYEIGVP